MDSPSPDRHFPDTSWTLVSGIRSSDPATASAALDETCRRYRHPLYCYLRRRGLSHPDAEDVLHDFFSRFLRLGSFENADQSRGRLRGYLATSLERHLINWLDHRSRRPASASDSHEAGDMDAPTGETPQQLYERKWALALLEVVTSRLAEDYHGRDKSRLFDVLKPILLAGGSLRGHDTKALAASLEMTEDALRTALHRLLREFGVQLRSEVRQLVESPADIDDEIDHLRKVFAR